jgi:hypothetical protein
MHDATRSQGPHRTGPSAPGSFGGDIRHAVGPRSAKRFDRQSGGANLNEETLTQSMAKEERHADQLGL